MLAFVLAIEVRFAVGVYDGRGDPSPTNVGVRFGDRGEVCGGRLLREEQAPPLPMLALVLAIEVGFAVIV